MNVIGVKCDCSQVFEGNIDQSIPLLEEHYLEIHMDQVDENGKGRIKFSVIVDKEILALREQK